MFLQEAGPLEEQGMVMAVLDKSFDVLILSLGVTKRVYLEVNLLFFNVIIMLDTVLYVSS